MRLEIDEVLAGSVEALFSFLDSKLGSFEVGQFRCVLRWRGYGILVGQEKFHEVLRNFQEIVDMYSRTVYTII